MGSLSALTNGLPLRHIFTLLDGSTNSLDTFAGPIGNCLSEDVSSWPVAANFKSIPISHLVKLLESVVDDMNVEHHYRHVHRICSAIIMGVVDSDLQYVKVGLIVHSLWLTLGGRIFRHYISENEPFYKPENVSKVLSSSLLFKLI